MGLSTDEPPSVRVVCEIADREDVDPTELQPPLWSVVDPEALDRLLADETNECTIQFRYCDYDVSVNGTGDVSIGPVAAGEPESDAVN